MKKSLALLLVLASAFTVAPAPAVGTGRVEGRVVVRGGAPRIPTVLLYQGSDYVWTYVRKGRFQFADVRPGRYRVFIGLISMYDPDACDWIDIAWDVDGRSYDEAPPFRVDAGDVINVTLVVTRPPCADVTFRRFEVRDTPLLDGTPAGHPWRKTIAIRVKNIGNRRSGPITVTIMQDVEQAAVASERQPLLVADKLPRLAPGERVSRTYPWDPGLAVGVVRITGSLRSVPETERDNNVRTVDVRFVIP